MKMRTLAVSFVVPSLRRKVSCLKSNLAVCACLIMKFVHYKSGNSTLY